MESVSQDGVERVGCPLLEEITTPGLEDGQLLQCIW